MKGVYALTEEIKKEDVKDEEVVETTETVEEEKQPSGFAIIFDSVPSRTATAEFVVPKSIPIILLIIFSSFYFYFLFDTSLKWWGRKQLPSGFHH